MPPSETAEEREWRLAKETAQVIFCDELPDRTGAMPGGAPTKPELRWEEQEPYRRAHLILLARIERNTR